MKMRRYFVEEKGSRLYNSTKTLTAFVSRDCASLSRLLDVKLTLDFLRRVSIYRKPSKPLSPKVPNNSTMDPNTSTREEFTTSLTGIPLPPVPLAPEWKQLAEQLRVLLDKLAHHPAMAPNLQQTYMTPAASKNSVYFMWDFVGRTLVCSLHFPKRRCYIEERGQRWADSRIFV